jgi:hypothetical protein
VKYKGENLCISSFRRNIQVATVNDEVIREALQSSITDFEDAVTSSAANATALEVIMTRNTSDFVAILVNLV